MAQVAKKGHGSRAAAAAAAAATAKATRSKLKKTTDKRFKRNKKPNPRSKLPKRFCHFLIRSLSRSCCCCHSCCHRSRSRTTLMMTEKGEQSLRRRISRRIKSVTELRLMQIQREQSRLELIKPERSAVLEPSETTLALLSHGHASVSEPEEVPPCLDSDPVLNGDLASS